MQYKSTVIVHVLHKYCTIKRAMAINYELECIFIISQSS